MHFYASAQLLLRGEEGTELL